MFGSCLFATALLTQAGKFKCNLFKYGKIFVDHILGSDLHFSPYPSLLSDTWQYLNPFISTKTDSTLFSSQRLLEPPWCTIFPDSLSSNLERFHARTFKSTMTLQVLKLSVSESHGNVWNYLFKGSRCGITLRF